MLYGTQPISPAEIVGVTTEDGEAFCLECCEKADPLFDEDHLQEKEHLVWLDIAGDLTCSECGERFDGEEVCKTCHNLEFECTCESEDA